MEGRKDDQGKPRWSLFPKGTLLEVAKVLTFGAGKYSDHNWVKVPNAKTRYYDAFNRHVDAWWRGERNDSETGLHHLASATCCLLFLMWLDWNGEQPNGS